MSYEAKDFGNLLGVAGLSDKMLKNHFTLYEGYVKNVNKLYENLTEFLKTGKTDNPEYTEIKRRFGWEFNGMKLHEYYFWNLTKEKLSLDKNSALFKKIVEDFDSYLAWEKDFRSIGAMRGIGWAMLCYEPRADKLMNIWINEHDTGHLTGTVPLLVMDVFEHAYMTDYETKRNDYIEAFFRAIDWKVVVNRYDKA